MNPCLFALMLVGDAAGKSAVRKGQTMTGVGDGKRKQTPQQTKFTRSCVNGKMPLFTAALMVKRWCKENKERELVGGVATGPAPFFWGRTFQLPIHGLTVSRELITRSHVRGELHFNCSGCPSAALIQAIHHRSGHLTPCQFREDVLAPVQEERHSSRQLCLLRQL